MMTLKELSKGEYGYSYKFYSKYKDLKRFLPRNATWHLEYYLCLFLYLYQMPKKKIKIYNTLTEKQKFSFLMKFLKSTLYSEKNFSDDIEFYDELKRSIENNKYWINHHKKKANTLDSNDKDYDWNRLRESIHIDGYEKKLKESTSTLTRYTILLLKKLIKKRAFLIDSEINIDRYLKN